MKKFDEYFSEESITRYLIRERLKRARRRGQFHNINSIVSDKYEDKKELIDDELRKYIPPRRTWLRPSPTQRCRHHQKCKKKNCRLECSQRQNFNSDDISFISLDMTFKKNSKIENNPYVKAIKELRRELLKNISEKDFSFANPEIIPIPKDLENGIYRPIAKYSLKDKIIISFTNRYFTDLFDSFFYDVSFAFRSFKSDKNHHKAFDEIIKYNSDHESIDCIWVSECDIQKFYDTVNHSIIKKEVLRLTRRVGKDLELKSYLSSEALNIFQKYLDSYAFNKNVKILNKDKNYWCDVKGNSLNKHFGWIDKDILKNHYIREGSARIGVPQGGALSGLIANIVLNTIDEKIIERRNGDRKLLYVRFCDDIVLLHTEEERCIEFYQLYFDSLNKLKLFPHAPSDISSGYSKNFWKGKTKVNYKWSRNSNSGFPWIGFVGYEINRSGNVRVRKKSIQKEIDKQRKWISDIIRLIKTEDEINKIQVENIAMGRLVGMSVGFFGVHNYQDIEKDMCWTNGFKCINDNPYTRMQLKRLDRERNKQISRLTKYLRDHFDEETDDVEIDILNDKFIRQVKEHYGRPFSYYCQGLR